jgi:DNA-binding CsgD family transcriptional regulator
MPAAKRVVRRGPARLDRAAQKKREQAIIADLKAGEMSYREIAQKHGVSLPTVNAKARKAGIRRPRGRRRVAAVATKAPRRRGRPPKSEKATVTKAAPRKRRRGRPAARRAGRPGRPAARRPGRPPKAAGFMDAFRKMVLGYFPNLTLQKYDRLVRIVESETGA